MTRGFAARRNAALLANHITTSTLGGVPLKNLTPQAVRAWYAALDPSQPDSQQPRLCGKDGAYPTPEDYAPWAVEFPDGNTCIRMPVDVVVEGNVYWVIGLDFDCYGKKTGGRPGS